MGVVKFRVTALRPALLLGVAEVWGHAGFWPLRRPVNYRVGGNCDEIRVDGGKLLVLQGKRLIAQAKYAPGPRRTQPARDVQWENLLQPGDRRGR
jgi:hypothetical protein